MDSDNPSTKMIDMERFIAVLKSKEELWNPKHKFYNYKFDKQRAWKELAKMFNCDEILLKTKWKSLRTMYARELKSCDESGYGGTWRYFNSMSFISTIKPKKRKGARGSLIDINNPRSIKRTIDSKYFDEGENSTTDQEQDAVQILKIEADEDESENSENEVTFEEQEIDPMPSVKRRKVDEENYDFMFLKSLLPFFQNLEPTRKLALRTKIQEVILSELNKGDVL